jgi:hypothetical protein
MNTQFDTSNILKQLDTCAKDFNFPILDNGYVYLADVRLTGYASPTLWVLIFETLGFFNRTGGIDGFSNALYCFGNNLNEPPGLSNRRFIFPISDGPSEPLFSEEDLDRIRLGVQTIAIRDQVVSLPQDPQFYYAKGIELQDPPRIYAYEVLRGLLPEYRQTLLATSAELERQMQTKLPRILRLDAWRHPDLINHESPSQLKSLQMIAAALVGQDPGIYQPTEQPNTHWSNWPEGGTL